MSGDHPTGSVAVLIAAGGRGERLRGAKPKALELLSGEPLLVHALRGVQRARSVDYVVVAAPPEYLDEVAALVERSGYSNVRTVAGGPSREASIAAALAALPADVEIVLTHDAARALTPPDQIAAVVAAVRSGAAAVVPGIPVSDTIKQVSSEESGPHVALATLDRAALRAIQTPQGFRREILERAHLQGHAATDDAGLVELMGEQVVVIPGHPDAIKITVPFDLIVAEAIVRARRVANSSSAE